MDIEISLTDSPEQSEVISLYRANEWSAADKPEQLMAALAGSHSLVTARVNGVLIGLGNALSDGHLVVYYPHLLVAPEYQGQGVGKQLMLALQQRYQGFHQQMLTADGEATGFYRALGFSRAGKTEPMWVYAGTDH
ncbi:GNAT family N-acetyltransferase [Amphritea atlantica]|uniref:GNAT family N-acetyltransferase n=1 Tax=Amphritea atlantica TaxID=355243 RepID=A0ABY5H189_9GAMM|nr:GNAT family N-acetyltransferase [Amphritea atlantica]